MLSKIKYDKDRVTKEPTKYNLADWILKPKTKFFFHIKVNNVTFMANELEIGENHIRIFKDDNMLCGTIYKEDLLTEIEIL